MEELAVHLMCTKKLTPAKAMQQAGLNYVGGGSDYRRVAQRAMAWFVNDIPPHVMIPSLFVAVANLVIAYTAETFLGAIVGSVVIGVGEYKYEYGEYEYEVSTRRRESTSSSWAPELESFAA